MNCLFQVAYESPVVGGSLRHEAGYVHAEAMLARLGTYSST